MINVIRLIFLIALFSLTDPAAAAEGKFIAFVGISGSGKSTTAREAARLCGGVSLHEPEESEWPECIRSTKDYGELSSLMVFRALRVDTLYKACELKEQGEVVFVDSYYDKITAYYLGKPGMEWLMDPSDPYFEPVMHIMQLDIDLLPDADCIVLFDIPLDDWVRMLESRGRVRDTIDGFVESYPLYKEYIESATEQLCERRGIPLVRFRQKYSSPEEQSRELHKILIKRKILKEPYESSPLEPRCAGPCKKEISGKRRSFH